MIPLPFVLSKVTLAWVDVRWGYEHKLLSWQDVVEFARHDISTSRSDFVYNISIIDKSLAHNIEYELRKIEPSFSDICAKKWMYVCLAWVFYNRNSLKDPFGDVEKIFADFDYPEEMNAFVRFMPPDDGYDPSKHTKEENYQRLERKWKEYLDRGFVA